MCVCLSAFNPGALRACDDSACWFHKHQFDSRILWMTLTEKMHWLIMLRTQVSWWCSGWLCIGTTNRLVLWLSWPLSARDIFWPYFFRSWAATWRKNPACIFTLSEYAKRVSPPFFFFSSSFSFPFYFSLWAWVLHSRSSSPFFQREIETQQWDMTPLLVLLVRSLVCIKTFPSCFQMDQKWWDSIHSNSIQNDSLLEQERNHSKCSLLSFSCHEIIQALYLDVSIHDAQGQEDWNLHRKALMLIDIDSCWLVSTVSQTYANRNSDFVNCSHR